MRADLFAATTSAIFLAASSLIAGTAKGGDVADVVSDLYGGDGILLAPTPPPFPSHAPHFTTSALSGLDNLNNAIVANVGQFAFNSTITGFAFDIERGVPVRTIESLGPLLAERAETLGENRYSVAVSYTRIQFTRFQGTDLEDLSLTFTHDDVNGDGVLGPITSPLSFELDQIAVNLDLEIEQDVLAFFGTYGVTDVWDIGVIVPIVRSRAEATANASIVRVSPISAFVHNFDPAQGDAPRSVVDREATGIGDVILRTKYNFLRDDGQWPDLSTVGRVKLPTGDEDDLLGTGETDFLALLVASETIDKVTPHINVGYEFSTESELSNVRYIAGFDYAVAPELTVASEILGRWEPDGDNIGDNILDLAFGLKWNPFGDFLALGNVQIPLNRDKGLRPDIIWTVGGELPF